MILEQCPVEKADDGDLGIENVGGVFVVLGAGCLVALVIAIFEFLWNVHSLAVEERVRNFFFLYFLINVINFDFLDIILILYSQRRYHHGTH